jgi:uncharacterized oligopeptide transporter (OPT) family protein
LIRALPSIISAITASAGSLMDGGGGGQHVLRTDRDTPTPVLIVGALVIVGFIWAVPTFQMNLMGAVLILVLGFLFSVVSSRITGEVGSSSCPLSGMTIGVLMGTCGAFLLVGWAGSTYSRLALIVGAIVCVAISNAGTCSQDLKTGFLIGATPVRQQGALLIGVLTSVLAVGWTMYFLNLSETQDTAVEKPFQVSPDVMKRGDMVEKDGQPYRYLRLEASDVPQGVQGGVNYLVDEPTREVRFQRIDGIGRGTYTAPQSQLMAVVINGLLNRTLPWDLILFGVAIAVFIEILGFRSLTFAVGVYLPLSSTMPVFLGGLVRKFADKRYARVPDAEDEQEGTLFCSGLIAGASLIGIASAAVAFAKADFGFGSWWSIGEPPEGANPPLSTLFPNHLFFTAMVVVLLALMFIRAKPQKIEGS